MPYYSKFAEQDYLFLISELLFSKIGFRVDLELTGKNHAGMESMVLLQFIANNCNFIQRCDDN